MGRRGRPSDRDRASRVTAEPSVPGVGLPSPDSFEALLAWRRDVRRFKPDGVPAPLLERILAAADLAPSVGNSQPWRIVCVETPALRDAARASFEAANRVAGAIYAGQRQAQYTALKLAGFDRAPVHLTVFCDGDPAAGHGLGRQTQPETLDHSCAAMIALLWLAARTHGVGMGWVSILDAGGLTALLDVPPQWRFIGYLLLGYPEEEHNDPELVRHGWQPRTASVERIFVR